MEDGVVTIARAAMGLTYPARFMLAAAMNPCPCGYFGDPQHNCVCGPLGVERYLARVSGPLLDRIDIHLEVPAVKYRALADQGGGESSEAVRERVDRALAGSSGSGRMYLPPSPTCFWPCPVRFAAPRLCSASPTTRAPPFSRARRLRRR